MNQVDTDTLQRDLIDILPENTGYILIALPIGVPAAPTFISNMEPEDSTKVLHAVLDVLDEREKEQGLGLKS